MSIKAILSGLDTRPVVVKWCLQPNRFWSRFGFPTQSPDFGLEIPI